MDPIEALGSSTNNSVSRLQIGGHDEAAGVQKGRSRCKLLDDVLAISRCSKKLRVKFRVLMLLMFALFTLLPACLALQLYTSVGQYFHHTLFTVLRYWVIFSFLGEGR